MDCPACERPNRSPRRYCADCGASLPGRPCPRCRFDNWPDERFCGGCGHALEGAPLRRATAVPPAAPRASAERRQLTVMFCDLVGSTALSGHLDVEELRDLLTAFQDACAAEISRHGGFIARYMGDGCLVYFGYPAAHEDDPARAVRAGLAIVQAVAALDHPSQPAVRVGLATGPVVVGDIIGQGASEEAAVIGETPNLAARLQSLAEPNTVVLADATRRMVGDRFKLDDLGTHPLKGFAAPQRAWLARSERKSSSRFEARRRELAPFVGREAELALLRQRWGSAAAGKGHAIALSGEAGIGKSRLLLALDDDLDPPPVARIRMQCQPHQATTSFHAVIDLIGRAARFDNDDSPQVRQQKLERWMDWTDDGQDRAALSALVGLSEPLEPDKQKRAVLAGFGRWIGALVSQGPVRITIEDVQWADPTTLDFIGALISRVSATPALLVLTHRPEFTPPWPVTSLGLDRLTENESATLIRAVGPQLTRTKVASVRARGDGVPAFLEELARMDTDEAVPDTLADLLMARLDRLPDGRRVAQTAAVLGRTFSRDLLLEVFDGTPAQVERGLAQLTDAGLVIPPGLDPTGQFQFRHTLLRDAAYDSLLRRSRSAVHGRAADAIEAADGDPALIAAHLDEAGRHAEGGAWHVRAAKLAHSQGGVVEEVHHLQAAIGVIDAPRPRIEHLTDLGLALRSTGALDEAEARLCEAEALAQENELLEPLARVWYAIGNIRFQRADFDACLEAHTSSLEFARAAGDDEAELRALCGIADANFGACRLPEALADLLDIVPRARAMGFEEIAAANGAIIGLIQFLLLDLDGALVSAEEAWKYADEVGHARARAVASNAFYFVFNERDDVERSKRWRERSNSALDAVGPMGFALKAIQSSPTLISQNHRAEAIELIRDALEAKPQPWMVHVLHLLWAQADPDYDDWDALRARLQRSGGAFPNALRILSGVRAYAVHDRKEDMAALCAWFRECYAPGAMPVGDLALEVAGAWLDDEAPEALLARLDDIGMPMLKAVILPKATTG